MRTKILLLMVFAIATIVSATPITNSTFDCPTCTVPRPPGYVYLPNVNTGITGWTIGGLGVNYVGEWNGTNGWQSVDGYGSVIGLNVVDPTTGNPDWGSVSQTLTGLTPSTTYTLFYYLSAAPGGKADVFKQINVQVAGTPAEIVTYYYQPSNSAANMNWEQHAYQFTTGAAQTDALLTFQSASSGTYWGAALDNVYYQEGNIPEPGTFSLLVGAGLAGLAFLKFKK